MTEARYQAPGWLIRWELALTVLLAACGFASIPLALGHIGLSWDALNHHIYLGWTAEQPRFDRDYLAALYQGYLFPYLYWPAYKLATAGASGVLAGVVLALLQATVVPAVWKIARACMPGTTWFDVAMRAIGVALAFMSCIVLSMFDTTSNDLLVAIPLVWAIALALEPLARPPAGQRSLHWVAVWSGLLAGASVAFKLSNGPIAIVLPLLWLWPHGSAVDRAWRTALGCLAVLLGFTVVYGYWGWQLWTHFGNPIYPFYDHWFAPLRAALGFKL
jgi:hypothetical protein